MTWCSKIARGRRKTRRYELSREPPIFHHRQNAPATLAKLCFPGAIDSADNAPLCPAPQKSAFINDTLRSDFQKKFLNKYIQ